MGTMKPAKGGKGGVVKAVGKLAGKLIGTSQKGGGGKKRHHGVAYYQNKLMKIKLKKKIDKARYGGR